MMNRVWKFLLCILGFVFSVYSPEQTVRIFQEPIFLVFLLAALIASLQIPHASLIRAEIPHKWIMQYALLPIIGGGAYVVWATIGLGGAVFYGLAVLVPISYWDTGVQSRAYRRDLALWTTDADTTREIVTACINGQEDIADDRIRNLSR